MGSLVGGLIALEWDFPTMRRAADEFSRRHPLRDLTLSRVSLLSGRGVKAVLDEWFGEWGIEETPIRYACVSANLTTGGATVHLRGKLKTWIRASTALPGVFPPVIDNGVVHIDGGVVNNLPVDIIRDLGVGFVIAVDVGSVALPNAAPGIIEISDARGDDGQPSPCPHAAPAMRSAAHSRGAGPRVDELARLRQGNRARLPMRHG